MSKRKEIIDALVQAYWKELETVQNYIANSVNLEGVRAEQIKDSLAKDVGEELTHAQTLARRIHELGGVVPGSLEFKAEQTAMQPPADSTDVVSVIRGVIAAEEDAIQHYNKLIQLTDGEDYVTQDLVIGLLADEESHRRQFEGFLKEFER
ncbi:MAG TPA: rubrerythrin [Bacteroidetes bacterium]|nr:rubrerythrin [Bacteroidota bacterium]